MPSLNSTRQDSKNGKWQLISEAFMGHTIQSLKDEATSRKAFDQEAFQYRNQSHTKQHLRRHLCANSAQPVRTGDQKEH